MITKMEIELSVGGVLGVAAEKPVCPGACHWWKPFKDDVVRDGRLVDIEVCGRCGKHMEICGDDVP